MTQVEFTESPRSSVVADSTRIHCSWCGVRMRESLNVWFHCEEEGSDPQPVFVDDCPGAEAWPIPPEVTPGVEW